MGTKGLGHGCSDHADLMLSPVKWSVLLEFMGKNTLGLHIWVVTNTNQYWNLLYLGMMHKQIESSFACCKDHFFSCPPPLSCRFHMKSPCIGFLLTLAAHSHWSHWISFDRKKSWYLRSATWAIYQWFSVCISVSMTSGNTCRKKDVFCFEKKTNIVRTCYNSAFCSLRKNEKMASDSCICRKTFSHWHCHRVVWIVVSPLLLGAKL